MAIDKKFIDQFINVTSRAAYASSFFIGKKDKIAADKAAVDSMRSELNNINMIGTLFRCVAVEDAVRTKNGQGPE